MRYQAGSVYFRPPSIHPTERVILHLHQLDWQRHEQPTLSAMTTTAEWCRVQLYNPTVVRVNGIYRMWYLGNSTATRTKDMDLGTATSVDGIHWEADPANPILTARHYLRGRRGRRRMCCLTKGPSGFACGSSCPTRPGTSRVRSCGWTSCRDMQRVVMDSRGRCILSHCYPAAAGPVSFPDPAVGLSCG